MELIFKLDADDVKKLNEWKKNHCGQLTYSFTGVAGIGMTTIVTCHGCKQTLDLTDMDKW